MKYKSECVNEWGKQVKQIETNDITFLLNANFNLLDQTLSLNIKLPTHKGILLGTRIKRMTEVVVVARERCKVNIDINDAYSQLGYISIAEARTVSQELLWKITGEGKNVRRVLLESNREITS
jgi:hypothetical protein